MEDICAKLTASTQSCIPNWVFPTPGTPAISVTSPGCIPPPRILSIDCTKLTTGRDEKRDLLDRRSDAALQGAIRPLVSGWPMKPLSDG